jgi:hypothetical protein
MFFFLDPPRRASLYIRETAEKAGVYRVVARLPKFEGNKKRTIQETTSS